MVRIARVVSQPARLARRGGAVCLRRPTPEDQEEYHELRRASRKFLAAWGMDTSPARDFRVFLDQGPGTSRERWLVCATKGGAILGAVTIAAIRREPFESGVLGYWIGAPHARQGFMTEALALAIRRAFTGLRLHRLEADVLPKNLASKRLLRRAGFTKEGLARGFVRVGGQWRDHERWALLASDVKKSQRPQSRR